MRDSLGTPTLASALRWATFIVVEANAAFLLVYEQVRELPSLRDQESQYATTFQPAGYVHLIYWVVGAAFFAFYAAALWPRVKRTTLFDPFVVPLAIVATLASAWVVAMRNDEIGLSLAFTAAAMLVGGAMFVGAAKMLSPHARALRLPFGLYFGWISFALLVNAAQWLNAESWLSTVEAVTALSLSLLALAALAGVAVAARYREFAYPAVIAWGVSGIYFAQRTFDPLVAYVALGCAALLGLAALAAAIAAALEPPVSIAALRAGVARAGSAPLPDGAAVAPVFALLHWPRSRPAPRVALEPGLREHLVDLDAATTGMHAP
jgi:hypothetical protein